MRRWFRAFRSSIALLLVVAGVFWLFPGPTAWALPLTSASITLSDARPSQTSTTHTIGWTAATTATLKCIAYKYTTTATGSTVPTGIDTTGAVKGTFTNLTASDWTLDATTNGTLLLTFATGASVTASTAVTTPFTTMTNTSTAGTFFVKINTYTNTDCSTGATDSVTIAASTTAAVTVSATVDPSLTFSVAGIAASTSYKSAGLTTSSGCSDTATAVTFPASMAINTNYNCAQQLTVSTNGSGGYTVTIRGTVAGADLVSGGNTITDHTGTNNSPAVFGTPAEAFGYTTSDVLSSAGDGTTRFSTAADRWAGLTNSALEVAYSSTTANAETTDVGFQLRFAGSTEAGTYTGTVLYTATPIF